MNQNYFSLVGRLELVELTSTNKLRLKLSDAGPIKVKAWADVIDPELIKVLTQKHNGFKPGDVVSLTGMIVLDELSGMTTLVVNKLGASRILASSAPLNSKPQVTQSLSPAQYLPTASRMSKLGIGPDEDTSIPF